MARITVEDCIDKFDSRFELVLVASNRARKLHSGEEPTVERDNDKNTVIALREIADETISAEIFKQNLVEEYQTVSPIDEEELALELTKKIQMMKLTQKNYLKSLLKKMKLIYLKLIMRIIQKQTMIQNLKISQRSKLIKVFNFNFHYIFFSNSLTFKNDS